MSFSWSYLAAAWVGQQEMSDHECGEGRGIGEQIPHLLVSRSLDHAELHPDLHKTARHLQIMHFKLLGALASFPLE